MEDHFPVKYVWMVREYLLHKAKLTYKAVERSEWRNERPENNEAYVPTMKEHIANIVTHGMPVLPTAWLSYLMYQSAVGPTQSYAAFVYGCVLTGLFTVSTVFHCVAAVSQQSLLRDLLHRSDRAMIYLFIAGSYTPWLYLRQLDGISVELRWAVWLLATLGIVYQQLFHERYKALETTFYVIIALFPALAVNQMQDHSGLTELKLGGAVYLVGVVFFKSDGKIPLAHAIWHLHVVVGSLIHFNAVNKFLIVPDNVGPF